MITDVKLFDWVQWRPKDLATLLFLFRGDEVLLIHKKRGLGMGKINGPGGRLEPGESYPAAAVRETEEETGLRVSGLWETAELSFVFVDGYSLHAKIFFADRFEGEPSESDEAIPFWCPVKEIPWHRMWADDPLWLKPALLGNYVTGRFIFDGDDMLSHELEIGPSIPDSEAHGRELPSFS